MRNLRQLPQLQAFPRPLAALLLALGLFACRDGMFFDVAPRSPAAVAVSYSVAPGAAELAASTAPDRARIQLLRGTTAVYDQVHALPPGETETRIRVEVELQSATESLMLVLQLMDGTQVVFSGSQPVTFTSGQTATAEMVVSNVLWGRIEAVNSQSVVRGQTLSLADSITVVARVTAGADTVQGVQIRRPEAGASALLGFYSLPIAPRETREIRIRTAAVPAGTYPLILLANNRVVAVGLDTVPAQVTQSDVTPPTLSILEPVNGSTVATDTVSLRFTAADNRGVARYRLSIDGRLVTTAFLGQASATFNSGVARRFPVQPGRNVITVTVFDVGLNATTDSVVFFRAQPVTSVTVTPSSATLAVGATQQYSATLRDAQGNTLTGRTLTWTSSNTGVATVSATGLATVVSSGTATITATSEGVSGTASITSAASEQVLLETITTGMYHSCGLTRAGKAYCWGMNGNGLLGDGTNTSRSTPTAVQTSLTFTQISAGHSYTVALTAEGKAYAWGHNDQGQLGDGTSGVNTWRTTPTAVQTSLTFTQISGGSSHTVALTSSGQAYAWGNNYRGQLGDGTTIQRLTPTAVQTSLTFAQIGAGGSHTVALTSGGQAYAWGYNEHGELGDGTTTERLTPTAVQTSLTFTQISGGANHTVVLTSGGQAYAWGHNYHGYLGDGTRTTRLTPTAVQTSLTFAQISTGGNHTLALTSSGHAYAWGWNYSGMLGDGTTTDRYTPTAVQTSVTFAQVSGGYWHSAALTTEGRAYGWGNSGLGDGERLTPRLVGQ